VIININKKRIQAWCFIFYLQLISVIFFRAMIARKKDDLPAAWWCGR
jgi:hypothetical protein